MSNVEVSREAEIPIVVESTAGQKPPNVGIDLFPGLFIDRNGCSFDAIRLAQSDSGPGDGDTATFDCPNYVPEDEERE